MNPELWTDVDRYIDDHFVGTDALLDAVLAAATDAGLPAISVSPSQGKLLMLLAKSIGAKRVLEIGTLAGYSTIWLARGLMPGGSIVTLECDAKHAAVARENFRRAALANVDVRVGAALDTLPSLRGESFDLVFIDADKANTPAYFQHALELTHINSMIIVDNVVRDGRILDTASDDPGIRGMRHFFDLAAAERRVATTAIQTVGSKGYDGFSVSVVVG
jgi:predicted O-methyltransferase YrrM